MYLLFSDGSIAYCKSLLYFLQQINPEKAREEFRNVTQKDGGTGVKDLMDGMGLGLLLEQVKLLSVAFGLQFEMTNVCL